MAKTIEVFRGDYAFLSNFYPAVITLDDMDHATVEHAFQAAKTLIEEERRQIQLAPSPEAAKRLGQQVTLRPDWEKVKYGIMESLVRQKFTYHSYLRKLLLDTGDAILIEGNNWGDRIWGMTRNEAGELVGNNWLGKILMDVRDELKKER